MAGLSSGFGPEGVFSFGFVGSPSLFGVQPESAPMTITSARISASVRVKFFIMYLLKKERTYVYTFQTI